MQLDTNNHSVFMLHYHLIMCVKYRNKVIDDYISNRLREIYEKIAPSYNITLEEWNYDKDHVHIVFRGQPNTEISKFINAYKDTQISLERDVLVTEFLSANHRRSNHRYYQTVYTITR